MNKIQREKPLRTCTKTYANYKSFKPYLREDFNRKCGYCDDSDVACGGRRGFHIDHFKPHSIDCFASLKQNYSNLVYSCPYCNGKKSDTWRDLEGFIDPCDSEYDNHIGRKENGKIKFKTEQGKYIYYNLNLGLKRHELLWCIDRLNTQSELINSKINEIGEGNEQELIFLRRFNDIQNKIKAYINIFQETI